uniref:uncharacterized protein LOC122592941 isoform X2 n=1 Tax=Erigeron canadensis TaxID=72917 RepID=UPI001CB8BBE9|nr:uncharacterized protein LOC122592941 isoform X2 [Erigeron canadensis]
MGVQQDLIVGSSSSDDWEESADEISPWIIGNQRWNEAEQVAESIISKFQPTVFAEKHRDDVIFYLQNLIKRNLDCEVFAYGSVPLKTYLPDGDIDLSVVGASTHDLIKRIASLLKSEGRNLSAEFVVKDVQLIGAEVKLVKCMVQNLVVDISVNQMGGLCTLCFLEQVDRVIMKDHLFKRSIILIKAWCYYESRTLGAHVGLISTYGLETLVLYIFHVFHMILDGPLSVLYKFLEYFSMFDWDNYGISLMGPVRLSELPRIIVDRPPNSDELLLEVGFLRHCSELLSVPLKPGDVFPRKFLNIVDPLNDHNNLGRSVSQGNFFRIRSAFGYGAKNLGQILVDLENNIAEELHVFFSNTLIMHGSGQRPDLPDYISRSSPDASISEADMLLHTRVTGKPRSSNDENSYLGSGLSGNQISREGKDVSALTLSSEVAASDAVIKPLLPHQYYSTLTNKMKNLDIDDEKQPLVHEEEVPFEIEKAAIEGINYNQLEQLDLTGDLAHHVACLDTVRWWNHYPHAPRPLMGPPPPPVLLRMIASEHGGISGVVHHPGFHPSDQMFMSRPPFVPNEPNQRGRKNHFPDMSRPRHGYHTSTSNTTNNGTPNTNDFMAPPEGVPVFVPVSRPVHHKEPILHRRKHQNPNRARDPDGTQRPRSVSGVL